MEDDEEKQERLKELRKHLRRKAKTLQNRGDNFSTIVQEEAAAVGWALGELSVMFRGQSDSVGRQVYPVYLTAEEVEELILLIDDEPVDEEVLSEVKRRMKGHLKKVRKRELQEV